MDKVNVNKVNLSPLIKVASTSNMEELKVNQLNLLPKVASTSNMEQLKVNKLSPPLPPIGTIYRSRSVNLRKKKHTPIIEERFLEEPPYLCYTRKEFRPRCNTDPNKFKHPRAGALDSLVRQTIRMNAGPIAIAVRPPPLIGPVEPPSNNSEDVSVGYFSIPDEKLDNPTIRIEKVNRRNSISSSTSSVRSTNSVSFGIRSVPSSPMAPLQGQTDAHGQSVININTITKSPSHLNNNNNNSNNNINNNNNNTSANTTTKLDSKSQKQLSSLPVTSTTSTATIAYQSQQSQEKQEKQRSISPHPIKSQSTSSVVSVSSTSGTTTGKNDIPEKEKKRKELSSSRQKKFHRHFQQVSKDEKVLNYFSCALVSDILLQGHLYITENYFAFYSNVFGFVTKLLIPTSSVTKISKEKTAKIIPNAVGVATIDERHVFGSFMSREAAFRLMCSVCPPLEVIQIPKTPDVENCEESIEDDSSCSISGNESPPQLLDSTGASTGGTCGGTTGSSDASQTLRHRPMPAVALVGVNSKTDEIDGPVKLILTANCTTSTPVKILKQLPLSSRITSNGITTTTTPTSTSTSPSAISRIKSLITFKFPTNFHIVYLGILLSIILTLFSGFLMYRILEIEAKASYRTLDINKWVLNNNDGSGGSEIYAEALKWQKELQTKSTEEAQLLLNSNLEQIARVRKSLETLSMLIHDTNPQFDTGGTDGSVVENFETT